MKQNQVIEPALELAFGPLLIWGLPPDLCSGSLSVLAIPVGHLSRVFLSRIVYVGIMKPEEQLLHCHPLRTEGVLLYFEGKDN